MRVRTQLFLFISFLVLSLSLSTIILFAGQYRRFAINRLEETGQYIVSDLADQAVDYLFLETYQSLEEFIIMKKNLPDVSKITVFDNTNRIVASNEKDLIGTMKEKPCPRSITIREQEICFVHPVEYRGEKMGTVQMILSKERINHELLHSFQKWIISQFVIVLVFLLFMYLSLKRFLSPLNDMHVVAAALSEGDFSHTVKRSRSLELNQISDAMNSMSRAVLQREQDNRELKDYLVCIINSISSAIIALDEQGKIQYWNKKISEYLEEDCEDREACLEKTSILDLPLIGHLPKDELIQSIKKAEPAAFSNLVFLDSQGSKQFAELKIFPLDSAERKGTVLLFENITDKKQYEKLMVETDKMMTIGGMAAGMAHEINNPLAGIVQNADLLQRRLNLETPKSLELAETNDLSAEKLKNFFSDIRVEKYLLYILQSGERISSIIRNMLDFARADSDTFENNKIRDLLEQSLLLARNEIFRENSLDFRSISIKKNYGDPELSFPCHAPQIIQVLLNLFKNSAAAMFQTGREPEISIHYKKEEDHILLMLEDNGKGIPDQIQKNLFSPFYTTKKKGEGTGLGMFISYHIIHQIHGGQLTVESDGESWTRFSITLPLAGDGNFQ